MVFLPILSRWGSLSQRKLYATCVGVIFPVCLRVRRRVSLSGRRSRLLTALPYLAGRPARRLAGRKAVRQGLHGEWLKWLFAGFLFYAGVKYLL